MISNFRAFTKSTTFKILMAVLILSFAVFGMNDLFSSSVSNNVIDAGPRSTTTADYRRNFDQWKSNAEQQGGKPITYEEAVKEGVHLRILEELADLDSLSAWLYKIGIRPSAKIVADQISKYPVFFDSVTGRFDKTKYQQVLAEQMKMDETKFEQLISDEMSNRQFIESTMAGLKPPRIYAAIQGAFGLETRDASFLVITPDNVEQPGAPTDAQLLTFYNENKERLRRPEFRQFTVASFAPGFFAPKVQIDEAELKKLYEFRRDTLSTPETRSFVQITVPDQAAAQAVSNALRSGGEAQAVAKANKGTVVTFDAKPRTAVPDRKVADAAFALKEGEVSGPVQGDLGLAVIKVNKVTAGSVTSFEAARAQLETDYRNDKAKELAYDAADRFEKERAAGADFNAAAQKVGVNLVNLPFMTAEGQTVEGQSFAQFAQVIKAAFEQPKGGETEVTDMGNGEFFALKVNEIAPSEVPALDKIKPQLTQAWQQKTAIDRVVAKGEDAVARLRKGESLEAVATALGVKVEGKPGLTRQTAQQLGPEVGGRVFTSKANEAFQARLNEAVVVVGKVTAINKPDAESVNRMSAMAAQRLAYGMFEDVNLGIRKTARAELKTKTYPQNAIRALGLDPAQVAQTNAADTSKAAQ